MLLPPILAVAIMLGNSSGVPQERARCEVQSERTDSWHVLDAGPFSIKFPQTYREVKVFGIDSRVGQWEDYAGHTVESDWGGFADDLSRAHLSLSGPVVCTETIDGHSARVITGVDSTGRFLVAASWRTVGPLTVVTRGNSAADRPTLLAILRSIVFKAQ